MNTENEELSEAESPEDGEGFFRIYQAYPARLPFRTSGKNSSGLSACSKAL
jgi:hypothetical protein